MSTKKITARTPVRIDLAGGTLDIWPIYLMLNRPHTLNVGIDLFAEATLAPGEHASDPSFVLRAVDQKTEAKVRLSELAKFDPPPALSLHTRLLHHFVRNGKPSTDLTLSTQANIPAGSGLGGSSAIGIALAGALEAWRSGQTDISQNVETATRLIETVRDIESQVLRVPAGLQDYYGAMFGGLQAIGWGVQRHHRHTFDSDVLPEIEKRFVLFYSGKSRNSGINNWTLYKDFIDDRKEVRKRFGAINDATSQLRTALNQRNWALCGQAIASEWENRKSLASEISTPEMDAAWKIGQAEGATAFKVCGAGGGGCFFLYHPTGSQTLAKKISEAELGIRALPYKTVANGLEIKLS